MRISERTFLPLLPATALRRDDPEEFSDWRPQAIVKLIVDLQMYFMVQQVILFAENEKS
jgi:hypothetical protein